MKRIDFARGERRRALAVRALPPAPASFEQAGLGARALPFAAVAMLAAASIALSPGPRSVPEALGAVGLLVLVAASFLLPWSRLPSWLTVLVPVAYSGSVLLLMLSTGDTVSGIGIVLLLPLLWTALYHRPWESAVVVGCTALVQLVTSLVPVALAAAVVARRVGFWTVLVGLLAFATHHLRNRLGRDVEARESLLRQTAALVTASEELTATLDPDQVLAVGTRLAAELVSPPGSPGRRAQYVRVVDGSAHVVAQYDETGAQVTFPFPLREHPNLVRVFESREALAAGLDPETAGPVVAELIRRLGVTYSVYVPVVHRGQVDGVLSVSVRDQAVPAELIEQCRALGHLIALALANARAHEALRQQAATDPLTRLPNRRAFEEIVTNRPGRAPFAILALDLDDLKGVNDTEGHAAGDALLVRVAGAVKAVMRRGDVLARIGGDEFAAFLFEATEHDARLVAERVLDALGVREGNGGTGVSVGLAIGSPLDDPRQVHADADAAMYAAKRAGGRRYEIAHPYRAENAASS